MYGCTLSQQDVHRMVDNCYSINAIKTYRDRQIAVKILYMERNSKL